MVRWQVALVDMLIMLGVSMLAWTYAPSSAGTEMSSPVLAACGFAVVWWACLAVCRSYEQRAVESNDGLKRVLKGTLWLFMVVAVVELLRPGSAVLRPAVFVGIGLGAPALLVGRAMSLAILRNLRTSGRYITRLVVIGTAASAGSVLQWINAQPGWQLATFIDARTLTHTDGDVGALVARQARDCGAAAVVVCDAAEIDQRGLRELAWAVERSHVGLLIAPHLTGISPTRLRYEPTFGRPMLSLDKSHVAFGPHVVKRAFDIVMASILLILLSPVLLVIALCITLEERGQIFFIQPRIGQNGRTFPFIKFRSMRIGAHLERAQVLGAADDGIVERYRCDHRITRVGRVIRRWSLDELPQLINVIAGHMSMVGPRPMLEEELPQLPSDGHRRHVTKPGLTGIWQVSGRKQVEFEDRIAMDLQYVDSWKLSMDFAILAKTAKAVVKGDGAF